MTIQEAQQQLLFQLYHIYDNREAANIADWVMEHLTGWKKIDRIVNKKLVLRASSIAQLEAWTAELLAHKPVQYVLHEAWFYGLKLYVDENVLIPRPETEELVEWVIKDAGSGYTGTILDIGTGSGCIPIAIQKNLPLADIHACDISSGALAVAQKNATTCGTDIHFHRLNILEPAATNSLPAVDCIISNPPYIPVKDKATMQANVLQYEPPQALFVENEDPLLFYRAIAVFAQKKLRSGGQLYLEVHEELGPAVVQLFHQQHFPKVVLRKDLQGKDRMVRVSGKYEVRS